MEAAALEEWKASADAPQTTLGKLQKDVRTTASRVGGSIEGSARSAGRRLSAVVGRPSLPVDSVDSAEPESGDDQGGDQGDDPRDDKGDDPDECSVLMHNAEVARRDAELKARLAGQGYALPAGTGKQESAAAGTEVQEAFEPTDHGDDRHAGATQASVRSSAEPSGGELVPPPLAAACSECSQSAFFEPVTV
jgi:hypothetical protein